MNIDPRTPVIVGAGQTVQRDTDTEEPREPVQLIAQALREAGRDAGTGERLLRRADSVRCVPVIGWQYRDAAALVAEELGAQPRETVQSAAIGGEGPQALLNDTAADIAAGHLDIALVGGGEAGASLRAAQLQGRPLPWRRQDDDAPGPTRSLGEDRPPVNEAEAAAGLAPPLYMYALIETALRAAAGSGPSEHLERIASLWSRFSTVAAENPHAWIRRSYTPSQIATPAPENRIVASPYTKLLAANIQVDMASGLIVTSAAAAQQAGVPRERWVFVHAGARAQDEWHVSERRTLTRSRAIQAATRAAMHRAGVAIDDIAHVDLYSCFPAAVQIAANELGLRLDDPSRAVTVTGGLTFAGGPGNNYAGHAVATLVGRLREDPGAHGLSTALGWYLTKHAVGIYSARPPRQPFASLDPRPPRPQPRRALGARGGTARVEAYTVTHRRDGSPEAAILSAITPAGERQLLRSDDAELVETVLAADPLGWTLHTSAEGHATLAEEPHTTPTTAPA